MTSGILLEQGSCKVLPLRHPQALQGASVSFPTSCLDSHSCLMTNT